MAHKELSLEMRACIDDCLSCYSTCEETIAHCTALGGMHAEAAHLALLIDCSRLCEISVGFMARHSERHETLCRICADACDACAKSCAEIDRNDATMRKCIEVCEKCADSCRQMAGSSAHA